MSHISTENPKCPYCDEEVLEYFRRYNFWDKCEQKIKCDGCGKTYECDATFSVTFCNWEIKDE